MEEKMYIHNKQLNKTRVVILSNQENQLVTGIKETRTKTQDNRNKQTKVHKNETETKTDRSIILPLLSIFMKL